MESSNAYPDSPMDADDVVYPCKGCGEILEEGKAFELAGNRWHIDCFRCNTCGTILDSDANLLLLGDGSLICNNCTYSCSVCNNKIEDLAILTGDQAFCANCFKCRNCKKKIENLKYARTSQGIFCMDCHESLMQRRRKKSQKTSSSRHKQIQQQHNNSIMLDKSLPSLPPNASHSTPSERVAAFSPDTNSPMSESYPDNSAEMPHSRQRPTNARARSDIGSPDLSRSTQRRPAYDRSQSSASDKHVNIAPREGDLKENLAPTQAMENGRRLSTHSDGSENGDDFIPMRLDPNPAPGPSPIASRDPQNPQSPQVLEHKQTPKEHSNGKNTAVRNRAVDQEPQPRFAAVDSTNGSRNSSQPSSPHIAHQYQERNRQFSSELATDLGRKKIQHGPTSSLNAMTREAGQDIIGSDARPRRNGDSHANGRFMLQEAPKSKKTEKRNSKGEGQAPLGNDVLVSTQRRKDPASASNQPKEQQVTVTGADLSDSSESDTTLSGSPKNVGSSAQPSEAQNSTLASHLRSLPERGDSLTRTGQLPQRRLGESVASGKLPNSLGILEGAQEKPASAPPVSSVPPPIFNPKNVNRSNDSPLGTDFGHPSAPVPPLRARERLAAQDEDSSSDSFVAPRAPPQPPSSKVRSETSQIRNGDHVASPRLPRYHEKEDTNWEDDQARTPGLEGTQEAPGFLRRVSHSMRHARSYSDRGIGHGKDQKWGIPKSPMISSPAANHEIGSPIASSPESRRDDIDRLRRELDLERQRVSELEAALDAKTSIKQMNSELKEKRSTIVVLDTQKEIVVRELETLTDHIAAAKRSGEPFDVTKMTSAVLREFAQELETLKNTFQPQIEDLTQRRNDLSDEVNSLDQHKDKTIQELEQLTAKNAQLADLNNQLVHQIQELYRANSGAALEGTRQGANALGIYSPHGQTHKASLDIREQRPSFADSSLTGTTVVTEQETEPGMFVAAPQVVNIRKAQPKKFNWKKGGHNVAKGVTKGLKGAFGSDDKRSQKEGMPATEGMPYGAMTQQDYPKTDVHGRATPQDQRPGFGGFFGKPQARPNQWKNSPNNSFPAAPTDGTVALFGSELEQRADFERTNIPSIVVRCIQEVDARGMDIEGIYRKSGSASQVQVIRDGFERNNDFDISDPDLDINAVTSTLKQYFRKLPTPLITFDVYNKLLDTATYHQAPDADPNSRQPQPPPSAVTFRVPSMRQAINELPSHHKDTLEVLVFHLARVIEHERDNLMTSLNTAVVFAPTIMRPESLTREMTDTQAKNAAVQFLIENCQSIFLSSADSNKGD